LRAGDGVDSGLVQIQTANELLLKHKKLIDDIYHQSHVPEGEDALGGSSSKQKKEQKKSKNESDQEETTDAWGFEKPNATISPNINPAVKAFYFYILQYLANILY
jgi:hypothetical protein